MDEITALGNLTQLGSVGVIGWLWLSERRASAVRERELSEAHERVMRERESVGALIGVVKDNTQALAALGEAQRALGDSLVRLADRLDGPGAGGSRRAG